MLEMKLAIPNIGEKITKYMSYLLTIFFFVFFLNILGLAPLGFNVTGNITITLSLALITYLITTLLQIKILVTYFWMPGVPVILKPVLPIELLGTIIKPFSLMIVCTQHVMVTWF
jgi:F-type H+-transporting ATPase subunit a